MPAITLLTPLLACINDTNLQQVTDTAFDEETHGSANAIEACDGFSMALPVTDSGSSDTSFWSSACPIVLVAGDEGNVGDAAKSCSKTLEADSQSMIDFAIKNFLEDITLEDIATCNVPATYFVEVTREDTDEDTLVRETKIWMTIGDDTDASTSFKDGDWESDAIAYNNLFLAAEVMQPLTEFGNGRFDANIFHEFAVKTAVAASGDAAKSENQMSLVFIETEVALFPLAQKVDLTVDDELSYSSNDASYTLTASESILWQHTDDVLSMGDTLCNVNEDFRGTQRCVTYLY